MIDLRLLRDRWTENGARDVFEELVLQCVRATICPAARRIQPNPGDGGLDTFTGEFDNQVKVWQAKYFPDGVGNSQQSQIRKSWNTLMANVDISRVTEWTLCVPILLDLNAEKWWQNWRKKQEKDHAPCKLHLWNHSNFVAFSTDRRLVAIFNHALERGIKYNTTEDLLNAISNSHTELALEDLPDLGHHKDALFVRKLEHADITHHAAARRSFYNFELLRTLITQGGNIDEIDQLKDLLYKVHGIWETEFHARSDKISGRQFYAKVMKKIGDEHQKQLKTNIPAGVVHKQGSLHYWADNCQAGWDDNYKDVAKVDKI